MNGIFVTSQTYITETRKPTLNHKGYLRTFSEQVSSQRSLIPNSCNCCPAGTASSIRLSNFKPRTKDTVFVILLNGTKKLIIEKRFL